MELKKALQRNHHNLSMVIKNQKTGQYGKIFVNTVIISRYDEKAKP